MSSFSYLHRFAGLPLALFTVSAAWAQQPDTLRARPVPASPATMFKLGLDAARVTGGYSGFTLPLYAGVERQLGQHWSLTADANVGLGPGNGLGSVAQLGRFGASVGARYYYSRARRQHKGKPVTALGGTYLQLQGSAEFSRLMPFYGEGRSSFRYHPGVELLWGYQRRLGRYGFMDVGAGLRVHNEPQYYYYGGPQRGFWRVEPLLRARIGLTL
ncbi:hypothetical protein GCM10027048_09970 [Hymenobacter coalescens]